MSKKVAKDLASKLKLTPEQKDAYDEFYRNLPDEPYKTFNSQEEFDKYVATKVGETTKELTSKLEEYETKPLLEEARNAFKQIGKESMFKYIQDKAFTLDENGKKVFNANAKKADFWKKEIEKMEDKENFLNTQQHTPFISKTNGKDTKISIGDETKPNSDNQVQTKTVVW